MEKHLNVNKMCESNVKICENKNGDCDATLQNEALALLPWTSDQVLINSSDRRDAKFRDQ